MQKTTNYGFNKPESTDFYNVGDFNENMDVIDEVLKEVADSSTSSEKIISKHLSAENPHGITKTDVGLSNVPNVSTNNQTPTYTVPDESSELSSGEKLSVAFGKIAKFIKDGIAKFTSIDTELSAINDSLDSKPTVKEGNTFSSLASFWYAYTSISSSNRQVAYMRFKDDTGWCPKGIGWYRAWITSQNVVGNGAWAVGGTILLIHGETGQMYIGSVDGGKADYDTLTVTWSRDMTLSDLTASVTELNYMSGVTSEVQTQINTLTNNLNSLLKTLTISPTSAITIAPGEGQSVTIPYTAPSGYTLVGAVGFLSGNVGISVVRVTNNRIDLYNMSVNSITATPSITLLFKKN